MIKRLTALFLLISIAAPAANGSSTAAREGFQGQMDAWNRGDLEGALRFYRDDAHLLFVSAHGVEHGIQTFANAMRADFGGKPGSMGSFSGEVLESRDLGPDYELIVVRWAITRGERQLFGGVSTQIWKRSGSEWRITVEHAS